MLELLREDLQAQGVFSGELPSIAQKIVESINSPSLPYRFKLTVAMSEIVLFASHLRRNIHHWNGSFIPVNSISFIIAGSGTGKDSAVSAARKCFSEGYSLIDIKRKSLATASAIKLAMLAGKQDPSEFNTYKEFYLEPNPLLVASSTAEGFIQHLNDLDTAGIGAGYTSSSEFGAELSSGGLIVDNIRLLSEIYDEGTKQVKVLKSRENQSKEIKGLPVSALYMGSQDNILYDEAIKKLFRREFSTKLARRSFFNFSPKMEEAITYTSISEMVEADEQAEDLSIVARNHVQDLVKSLAVEALKGAGQPLEVSSEVRSLFIRYKRYNEELAATLDSQYPISKIVRSHMQWKALKLSGAIAIFNVHKDIEVSDYIQAISYCEMLASDMKMFEIELVKEPYEVFVTLMHLKAVNGESSMTLHNLRKQGFISTTGVSINKMKELVQLATSYDKEGIYTIEDNIIHYKLLEKTPVVGASFLAVTGTKEDRQYQCAGVFDFYETTFNELASMLQEDLAYSPFQFKDGKRGRDNVLGGCKWICLDIDESIITDEECHFILQDINHHIARTSNPDNAFKFRILIELDAVVDVPDLQWKPFISSISDSLSLKADLLPKSQIYFSYTNRDILSVTDKEPLEVKEHLLIAASTEGKTVPPTLTTAQQRTYLADELSTFAFAFNAPYGSRARYLMRAVYYAKDLGATIEYTLDLIDSISNCWDEPAQPKHLNGIRNQIKRLYQ